MRQEDIEEISHEEPDGPAQLDQSQFSMSESIQENINFSQIYHGKDKEKFQQFDLISEVAKDHPKIQNLLKQRFDYLEPIHQWWVNGNQKAALFAINKLDDPWIILDAVQMTVSLNKLHYVTIEGSVILVQKCRELIESKYLQHVKGGVEYSQKLLDFYKDELISIKTFAGLCKNDLARDQRVKNYDTLLQQFRQIAQMTRLRRLAQKNDDLSKHSRKLLNELLNMLQKIDKGAMEC
jgi:katanin p80 WD40 repeat-containing subunit B1